MSARDLDGVFYCGLPPTIAFESDGLFHIGYEIGERARFEIVLTPAVFLKALRNASRVAEQFQATGTVVPMRRRRKDAQPAH